MDDYPEHLAPEFTEGGGVATPFDEWWPNGKFPTPIVVLDNRNGHLSAPNSKHPWQALPPHFVLIEGHRRFNLALHLQRTERRLPTVKLWVMTLHVIVFLRYRPPPGRRSASRPRATPR